MDDYYTLVSNSTYTLLLHVGYYSSYQLYIVIEELLWPFSMMHMGYVHFEHIYGYPFGHFTSDMPLDWLPLQQIAHFSVGGYPSL